VESLLRGFKMDINCDPEKQGTGQTCNSNAIWPTKLDIEITGTSVNTDDITNTSNIAIDLSFVLERGWTPMNGGGKPFNYVLDFNVIL